MTKTEERIEIGLTEEQRGGVVDILNGILADQYILYTKTRNYHWNVVGPDFSELHKFFESQYEELDEAIDEVAERVRAVGGVAAGSLKEFLRTARLKEAPDRALKAKEMIADLLSNHEETVRNLRTASETVMDRYHDSGTNDFLIGLMEKHEKMAWMLRAYLE